MPQQKQYSKLFPVFLLALAFLLLANFLLMIMLEMSSNEKPIRNNNNHQLCILFPFKNRWDLAQITIPKLDIFLKSQHINSPKFIIINQTDNYRFNRASLLNIGSLEAKKQNCDYIALHDIDIGFL
uniref:Glyco_transf_7N domain-containing protein n=1 Tax=Meloidogyne hapla TaxID=6305 RepID=A0A1I8B5R3_MELHA